MFGKLLCETLTLLVLLAALGACKMNCSIKVGSKVIYDGDVDTTVAGKRCLNWNRVGRYKDDFLPQDWRDNKCRGVAWHRPWCYIKVAPANRQYEGWTWDHCPVPSCPQGDRECHDPAAVVCLMTSWRRDNAGHHGTVWVSLVAEDGNKTNAMRIEPANYFYRCYQTFLYGVDGEIKFINVRHRKKKNEWHLHQVTVFYQGQHYLASWEKTVGDQEFKIGAQIKDMYTACVITKREGATTGQISMWIVGHDIQGGPRTDVRLVAGNCEGNVSCIRPREGGLRQDTQECFTQPVEPDNFRDMGQPDSNWRMKLNHHGWLSNRWLVLAAILRWSGMTPKPGGNRCLYAPFNQRLWQHTATKKLM